MVGIVLLGVFVLLLALGAPIAVCLGMSSVSAILVQGAGKPLEAIMSVLPRLCSSASSKFVLLAIPFFILSGNVMEKAGISGRLINLAEKCLGHIRGGMAMVCVVVSCFFAAISGSGPATVAALGLIMIPALVKAGYPASFSCALMAAGGAIGVVIPPSITFVVYGSIADASIVIRRGPVCAAPMQRQKQSSCQKSHIAYHGKIIYFYREQEQGSSSFSGHLCPFSIHYTLDNVLIQVITKHPVFTGTANVKYAAQPP